LLRDALGLNVKVVGGYTDSTAIFLATERGEVASRTVDLSTVRTFGSAWLKPNGGMEQPVAIPRPSTGQKGHRRPKKAPP
jgi:hypothetical protein